jgi:hypothetical protein
MNRYNNGKIYKIVDNTNGNIYIGSTCEPTLARRLAGHRGYFNSYLKGGSVSKVSYFKILENNDYSIVLLEEYPCETKDQLLSRERYYIENNDCVNKVIPSRTAKEYYQDNRDKIKEYYQDNRDKIKKYYQDNRDKIKKYYQDNRDKRKEYNTKNKDKIIDYQKEYYNKTKEDKLKKLNEKVICECGSICSRSGLTEHLKTNKHKKLIEDKKLN